LFVVPQQHYFLQGGEEMMKSLECIVIRFFFLVDPICWKNVEGRKKKKVSPKMFCVINTNGGCQIWPGIHLYGYISPPPATPLLSCMCVVIMIGDAIGIGADLFSHLSFCLTAAGI
jgi:hypothetical protein